MNTLINKCVGILLILTLITGCKSDMETSHGREDASVPAGIKSQGSLLEIAYDITNYQTYEGDFEKLTELDLAHINPSEEKQRVEMALLPDGTTNMTVEELEFERTIHIPHQTF